MNEDFIAFRYRDWINSKPFDVGQTVRQAISKLSRETRELTDELKLVKRETRAKDVKKTAKRMNKESKSNGCLMRLMPLIVWASEIVKDSKESQ